MSEKEEAHPKSVIERYYQQQYMLDIEGCPNHDQYVYQHSNGLYVIGIAPSHPLLKKKNNGRGF